jgi:hypothetical protein
MLLHVAKHPLALRVPPLEFSMWTPSTQSPSLASKMEGTPGSTSTSKEAALDSSWELEVFTEQT